MTLLEHIIRRGELRGEKRSEERGYRQGKVETLVRVLSVAFSEFAPADADLVRNLSDEALDELTDAIALWRPWAEIESIIGRRTDGEVPPGRLSKRT